MSRPHTSDLWSFSPALKGLSALRGTFAIIMIPELLAFVAMIYLAPIAQSRPPSVERTQCAPLVSIRESLDNDIDFDYLRDSLNRTFGRTIYTMDAVQKMTHGIYYMGDINSRNQIPGLKPLLDQLAAGVDDIKNAVKALSDFDSDYGSYINFPTDTTWQSVDFAEQKKPALYGLIDKLQSTCV